MVDPVDDVGDVSAWCTDNDLLGPLFQMHRGLFPTRHLPRALHDVVCARALPVDVCGITLGEQMDDMTAVEQPARARVGRCGREESGVVRGGYADLDGGGASPVGRVVADSSEEVLERQGGVVDSDDGDVCSLEAQSEESSSWVSAPLTCFCVSDKRTCRYDQTR